MRSHWATYRPGERRGSALPGLDIRPAEFADCADIAAIAHERDGVPLAEAQTRCESDVVHADRLLLVATVGGELAAFGRAARWQRPSDAPNDVAPDGWYLLGVVVRNRWRRRGIGLELTRQRLEWIRYRADEAYYFANAQNRSSIDLHKQLGFVEVSRDSVFPGASFDGGEGILFRMDLSSGGHELA